MVLQSVAGRHRAISLSLLEIRVSCMQLNVHHRKAQKNNCQPFSEKLFFLLTSAFWRAKIRL